MDEVLRGGGDEHARARLSARLLEHHGWLEGVLRRRAGWLLRVEGLDDLVQDVRLRALGAAERFVARGDAPFRAWLATIARQHLVDRRRYWSAERRNAGPMLRVTGVGPPSTYARSPGIDPAAGGPGPATLADLRDQHGVAMRALRTLLPRDQQLVEWIRQGRSAADIAAELGATEETAGRARRRAIERFRRAYELLAEAHARA